MTIRGVLGIVASIITIATFLGIRNYTDLFDGSEADPPNEALDMDQSRDEVAQVGSPTAIEADCHAYSMNGVEVLEYSGATHLCLDISKYSESQIRRNILCRVCTTSSAIVVSPPQINSEDDTWSVLLSEGNMATRTVGEPMSYAYEEKYFKHKGTIIEACGLLSDFGLGRGDQVSVAGLVCAVDNGFRSSYDEQQIRRYVRLSPAVVFDFD